MSGDSPHQKCTNWTCGHLIDLNTCMLDIVVVIFIDMSIWENSLDLPFTAWSCCVCVWVCCQWQLPFLTPCAIYFLRHALPSKSWQGETFYQDIMGLHPDQVQGRQIQSWSWFTTCNLKVNKGVTTTTGGGSRCGDLATIFLLYRWYEINSWGSILMTLDDPWRTCWYDSSDHGTVWDRTMPWNQWHMTMPVSVTVNAWARCIRARKGLGFRVQGLRFRV